MSFPGIKGSLGLFALLAVASVALEILAEVTVGRVDALDRVRWDLSLVLPQVAMALVFFWYLSWARLSLRDVIVMKPLDVRLVGPLLVSMAGTFVLVVGLLGMAELVWGPPDDLDAMFDELFERSHAGVRWVAAAVLAPVGEEIFFRGLVLRGLARRYGPTLALLVSSVLFGILHVHPYRMLLATLLGLHLGWWFLRTRNLLPCFLAHGAVNFTVGVLLVELVPDETLEAWEETGSLGESLLAAGLGAVLAYLGFRAAARLHPPLPPEEEPPPPAPPVPGPAA